MDWAKIALVFAFLALAARSVIGQDIYFDDADGIQRITVDPGNENPAVTNIVNVESESGRRICFSPDGIYYTDGGNEVFDEDGEVVFTAPDGAVIDGLDCCCQLVVITYKLNGCYWAEAWSTADQGILVMHKLATLGTGSGDLPADAKIVVKCSSSAGVIVIVSRRYIWIIVFSDLDSISRIRITTGTDPFSQPDCVACKVTGAGEYRIYVSVSGGTSIITVNVDVGEPNAISNGDQFINSDNGAISVNCIAYDEDADLLYLIGYPTSGDFSIESVDADSLGAVRTVVYQGSGELPDTVHGLAVCGQTCMTRDCTDFTCDCTEPCGFCIYPGSECHCENSNTANCVYTDSAVETECRVCEDALDVCLIIYNPLYERRWPGDVKIIGITTEDNVDIDVARYVTIGRFSPAAWPKPNEAVDVAGSVAGDVYYSGFRAPLTANLRGSRSGVYRGIFTDADTSIVEIIPGIATEASGFYQTLYTYTVSVADDVTLTTTTNTIVAQFRNSFVWRFTPNGGSPVDNTPRCDLDATRQTCTIDDVTTNDEGSYEVYRRQRNRRLRNWHPIIYLCVRRCEHGMFGPSCTAQCPECVNGVCDEDCGTCVCLPGWTGDQCQTSCDLGEIGQTCDVDCDDLDLFDDKPNCEGLLICYPRKVGCACIPGKRPPLCTMDCEDGYFGSNCLRECNSACDDVCDKRTGSCTVTG